MTKIAALHMGNPHLANAGGATDGKETTGIISCIVHGKTKSSLDVPDEYNRPRPCLNQRGSLSSQNPSRMNHLRNNLHVDSFDPFLHLGRIVVKPHRHPSLRHTAESLANLR